MSGLTLSLDDLLPRSVTYFTVLLSYYFDTSRSFIFLSVIYLPISVWISSFNSFELVVLFIVLS